jgi:hypothetical protein
LKITEVSQIFGLLYSVVEFKHKFGQKIGWATFWMIFSQTHLVTLLLNKPLSKNGAFTPPLPRQKLSTN